MPQILSYAKFFQLPVTIPLQNILFEIQLIFHEDSLVHFYVKLYQSLKMKSEMIWNPTIFLGNQPIWNLMWLQNASILYPWDHICFRSVFTISWLSIFTTSCKCIFGKTGIYVKYWSWFRINLFFGENVTMNVCVCVWQCLNHLRAVWNVWIARNVSNLISILTLIGPN